MSEDKIHNNPFTVPEGYFAELEDRLREVALAPEPQSVGWLAKVKPAMMLALMFGVIAGFGWIVSKITGLLYTDPVESDDPITAMIEEGWIESSFIYAYSDEIDVEEALINSLENTVTMDEELSESIEALLSEEDIIRYQNLE
jgi:hypothetical protein